MAKIEREILVRALSLNDWHQNRTAQWLSVHVNTLANKMKTFKIEAAEPGPRN